MSKNSKRANGEGSIFQRDDKYIAQLCIGKNENGKRVFKTATASTKTEAVMGGFSIMKVGYVRCSTEEQNEERQIKMMNEQNTDKIFMDKASGKDTNRTKFKEMMGYVREGDVIVVESVSRIARNTSDLLSIVAQLADKGVEFVSLKENIDTSTPQGRFMLTVFGALAELERESILERQREGIKIAKEQGKYKGRKQIEIDETRFRTVCTKWRSGKITAAAAMRELRLQANTFYRRVKKFGV